MGERGCRLHLSANYTMASGDDFVAGAFDQSAQDVFDARGFSGSSGGVDALEAGVTGSPAARTPGSSSRWTPTMTSRWPTA